MVKSKQVTDFQYQFKCVLKVSSCILIQHIAWHNCFSFSQCREYVSEYVCVRVLSSSNNNGDIHSATIRTNVCSKANTNVYKHTNTCTQI